MLEGVGRRAAAISDARRAVRGKPRQDFQARFGAAGRAHEAVSSTRVDGPFRPLAGLRGGRCLAAQRLEPPRPDSAARRVKAVAVAVPDGAMDVRVAQAVVEGLM